ncbi:hypothetical protein SODALDRAFT_361867 [Sodiomyces alkalinus F11]|uniref:Uncharacterized protein n=1 Tax=Sodiomyces alkalinus (strain CBS 110278 / VKM F-3762 / F11) TaxID=1314773 RepID=A0A3N2PRF1_SODAK|nr:hypothetical protein SODALDRAFT_361867 [Sodiomyces alkalinus F11]ROT37014.1 hypothetical protein SODALDRAFT_361867 [Sodiomyces alkalinus F11]
MVSDPVSVVAANKPQQYTRQGGCPLPTITASQSVIRVQRQKYIDRSDQKFCGRSGFYASIHLPSTEVNPMRNSPAPSGHDSFGCGYISSQAPFFRTSTSKRPLLTPQHRSDSPFQTPCLGGRVGSAMRSGMTPDVRQTLIDSEPEPGVAESFISWTSARLPPPLTVIVTYHYAQELRIT